MDGALEAVASRRVVGLSMAEFRRKRPLLQRPPMTVTMMQALKSAVFNEKFESDKIFAGYCCFMAYGRLRFSDAQRIIRLALDVIPDVGGYLDADQRGGKTANSMQKQTTFLPVAAAVWGVLRDLWWVTEWMKLLEAHGFLL